MELVSGHNKQLLKTNKMHIVGKDMLDSTIHVLMMFNKKRKLISAWPEPGMRRSSNSLCASYLTPGLRSMPGTYLNRNVDSKEKKSIMNIFFSSTQTLKS